MQIFMGGHLMSFIFTLKGQGSELTWRESNGQDQFVGQYNLSFNTHGYCTQENWSMWASYGYNFDYFPGQTCPYCGDCAPRKQVNLTQLWPFSSSALVSLIYGQCIPGQADPVMGIMTFLKLFPGQAFSKSGSLMRRKRIKLTQL